MKTKKLKVAYSTRWTGSYYRNTVTTPKIQMEGKWLEALGFHIGDMLQVDYEEGAIHIRAVPQEPAASPCFSEGTPVYASKKNPKK